jgi:hypothetical protein
MVKTVVQFAKYSIPFAVVFLRKINIFKHILTSECISSDFGLTHEQIYDQLVNTCAQK